MTHKKREVRDEVAINPRRVRFLTEDRRGVSIPEPKKRHFHSGTNPKMQSKPIDGGYLSQPDPPNRPRITANESERNPCLKNEKGVFRRVYSVSVPMPRRFRKDLCSQYLYRTVQWSKISAPVTHFEYCLGLCASQQQLQIAASI